MTIFMKDRFESCPSFPQTNSHKFSIFFTELARHYAEHLIIAVW